MRHARSTTLAHPERRAHPRVTASTFGTSTNSHRVIARAGRVFLLAVTDLCALFLAGAAAFTLWALPERGQSAAMYLDLAPLLALFVFGYAAAGLYPGFGLGPVEILRRLSYVTSFGFLILAAFTFALKLPHLYSRVTFAIALAFSLLLVPLLRALLLHLVARSGWWPEPVVIVGGGQRVARAKRDLSDAPEIGYRAVAVLALDDDARDDASDVPVFRGLDQAAALSARGIHTALLETDQLHDRRVVDELHRGFRHIILLREFDDLPVEGLHVRNFGRFVGIEYTNNLARPGNRAIKRALDVVLASLALLLLSPVLLIGAAFVRALDGAPAFFTQARTGFFGRKLTVPKIRTMRRDAEKRLEDDLAANPSLREEWKSNYKLKNDPRLIPVVGRFLRRFSIDELPQLWTVLQGRMSLVGPRPLPDYHLDQFSADFIELRRRVRPGITGLWQISVRSESGVREQEAHDSYYIRNWSVWLDLYILSRTVSAVLSGRGAY